jgi:hypothetical protein
MVERITDLRVTLSATSSVFQLLLAANDRLKIWQADPLAGVFAIACYVDWRQEVHY